MASYHERNKYGRIRIGRGVIEGVCARVINEFEGRVLVSSPRGRHKKSGAASAEAETGFARARIRDRKLDIKLYLIALFGTSMRESAKSLADRLREAFPAQIGIDVGLITMVFVGTLAEKLTKRNITYIDNGESLEIIEDE